MERSFYNLIYKICNNRWIISVKRGLLKVQHLILASCLLQVVFSIIQLLNININKDNIVMNVLIETQIMMDSIRGPLCIIAISYSLAQIHYNKTKLINPIIVSVVSLVSVLIINIETHNNLNMNYNEYFLYRSAISIFFTLSSVEIFIFLYKKCEKYIKNNNKTYNYYVNKGTSSCIPSILTIIIIILLKIIMVDTLFIILNTITLRQNGVDSVIKETISLQLSWFMGGNSLFFGYSNKMMQYYTIVFAHIGGAGSTLSLIISLKIIKKFKNRREVIPKMGVISSLFNINEPIVYGLPVIFNPIYIIPFIFTPVILTIVTYLAIKVNFISIGTNDIHWSMPILFNAYILTNSINGIILQVVNIIIGVIIYMPFVALSDKVYEVEMQEFYKKLKENIFSGKLEGLKLTSLDGNLGVVSRILAVDLSNDLLNNERLYLQYQPQVDKQENIFGVEGLCRWNHKILGNIPPNIFIQIAEESGLMNSLGDWIIDESCNQLRIWNKELNKPIEMSINISPSQLKNEEFYEYIKSTIEKNNIKFENIKLEITESLALGNDKITEIQIKKLNNLGIKFAIDDFGQGYNPILYIKKYNISTLKLDGSLIRDIENNNEAKYIVHAMYTLSKTSGMKIVCECVENYKQKNMLDKMGDGLYQGYLFSKPLDSEECLEYIKAH